MWQCPGNAAHGLQRAVGRVRRSSVQLKVRINRGLLLQGRRTWIAKEKVDERRLEVVGKGFVDQVSS